MRDRCQSNSAVDRTTPQGRALTTLWLAVIRRYLIAVAAGHLVWEFIHLPLYTIWQTGNLGALLFAATHCTGGDILIATASLMLALIVFGQDWPHDCHSFRRVAAASVLSGLSYTIFSEWLNTTVRKTWAYSELMPVIPGIETGMSPVMQWLLIPLGGFWWASRLLYSVRRLPVQVR